MHYIDILNYINDIEANIRRKQYRHGYYKPDSEIKHLESVIVKAVENRAITQREMILLQAKIKLLFDTL